MYLCCCSTLKIKQSGIRSKWSHLSLISLPEAGRWDRRSGKGAGGGAVEGGVVEVVGMAEVVDGAGVMGAGEVGGGVVAVVGVVGVEERG
jgi:hypothetical protein